VKVSRDMHDLIAQLYVLDNEPFARRQQQLWIHPSGWPGDPPSRRVLPGQFRAMQPAPPDLDMLGFGDRVDRASAPAPNSLH